MEIRAFLALVVPFIIVVYLGVLLFVRAPRQVVIASLLGGLVASLINIAVDLIAYYAHWWHYDLNNLILHLPLPFYISTLLVYGSIAYLLIWRFWEGRGRWFALLLLYGIPVFGLLREIYGQVRNTSYAIWDNTIMAVIVTFVMWVVMFYAGYIIFRRYAPAREEEELAIQK